MELIIVFIFLLICLMALLVAKKNLKLRKELEQLDKIAEEINHAVEELEKLLNFKSGYLMKKTWDDALSISEALYEKLITVSQRAQTLHSQRQLFSDFNTNYNKKYKSPDIRVSRNEAFKAKEIEKCDAIFKNVEGHALDNQQKDAIVTDEYNNLVIAGAGSGKTLTILGKVRYLVERLIVKPEEILLISFTRKTVEELSERLMKMDINGVDCMTFHALGLKQQSGVGVANENELSICISNYLKKEIKNYPDQIRAFLEFYGCHKYVLKEYSEYKNPGQRYVELKASDLVTLKGKLDTMDTFQGERVKSLEELLIANYLFLHGVKYEYEKNYTGKIENIHVDRHKQYRRAYQPDFYLSEYDIWLEHFGINEQGRAPWLKNWIKEQEYIEGIEWKRKVHAHNNTKLIESYSFWNQDQNLTNKLEALLKKNGVEIKTDSEFLCQAYEKISNESRYLSSMKKLIATFLSLAKANKIGMDEAWELGRAEYANNGNMWHRFELFMTFTEPIYKAYEKRLEQREQIDFDDMINKATEKIKTEGIDEPYRYIIVDEYQDVSKSKFDLILAIREENDSKLMCVGDDWQSIYRFAGSDISLFTHFEEYVGYSEKLKIETTYRNSQELVDIASEFIEANPSQVHKVMKSTADHVESPMVICQIEDLQESFELALKNIFETNPDYDGKILVLGRHNMDIENIYPDLEGSKSVSLHKDKKSGDIRISYKGYDNIQFMSVHKSKGLEADDVIVLNLLNGIYGFPNRVEDDVILQLLLADSEDYMFAEERRLFYVAITRTKNMVYLISTSSNGGREPSPFIAELKKGDHSGNICILMEDENDEWDPLLCPRCGSGRLIVRTNSKTNKQFLGCTNYPFCTETYRNLEIANDRIRCPKCNDWMVRRRRRSDGNPFFGCSNFPKCKATYDADENYKLAYVRFP